MNADGEAFLPYTRHHVTEGDIARVAAVLRSSHLTQGPEVAGFERDFRAFTGADAAVACASGTAALHLALLATGIGPGDVVVTSPITFVATAHACRLAGADVWFADIDPATANLSVESLERLLAADRERRVKAVIPVHFAGLPAALPGIASVARRHGALVIADAAHGTGAFYRHDGREYRVGGRDHADVTAFSFHPAKHVAMGEGGILTFRDEALAERARRILHHGIEKGQFEDAPRALDESGLPNPWYYEVPHLGVNYRLSDIHAALGRSQLERVTESLEGRRRTAEVYRELFGRIPEALAAPLTPDGIAGHAYHLFVAQIDFQAAGVGRSSLMRQLSKRGIGSQVHYIPVHTQPFYRRDSRVRTDSGCPMAMRYYERAISLPMYYPFRDEDCHRVVLGIEEILGGRKWRRIG